MRDGDEPTLASSLRATDVTVAGDDTVQQLASRIFETVTVEAAALLRSPITAPVGQAILSHNSLTDALASAVSQRLCDQESASAELFRLAALHLGQKEVLRAVVADIAKAWKVDPAVSSMLQPIFLFKGFLALTAHRVAHALWTHGSDSDRAAALLIQSRVSETFGVDIQCALACAPPLLAPLAVAACARSVRSR
jgi:serine O-acetyltransferase